MIDFTTVNGRVDLMGQTVLTIVIKGRIFPADAPLVISNGVTDSIILDGCENVVIAGMKFGDLGTTDVRALNNRPVVISNSKFITVSGNEVARCSIGISLNNVTDSLVDGNVIHDLNEDGIRPLDCERVTIKRNEMYDWYINTGKHPDAMQPWNPHLGHDADGLTIIDNCIRRGAGEVPQGISVRYQDPTLAKTLGWASYKNLVVKGNLLIGLAYNGLTLSGQGLLKIMRW